MIVRRSSFVVHRSSFVVRRSSFVVRRSSFVVRRSSLVVRRSSFIVRRCWRCLSLTLLGVFGVVVSLSLCAVGIRCACSEVAAAAAAAAAWFILGYIGPLLRRLTVLLSGSLVGPGCWEVDFGVEALVA